MTALLKTILIRIIAVGALAGVLMAQGPGPRKPRTSATPPDPATIAQRQVRRLTRLLALTPAQVTQATTIFTNSLTATGPLETTLRNDRQSLQTAISTNALSVIDQVSQNIGTLTGQILSIESKANAAFYAILTADQQAQFTKFGGLRASGRGPGLGARSRGIR